MYELLDSALFWLLLYAHTSQYAHLAEMEQTQRTMGNTVLRFFRRSCNSSRLTLLVTESYHAAYQTFLLDIQIRMA